MNTISGIGRLVSRMRELENSRPSPSIADVAGNPDTPGPDTPDQAELTNRYEMEALINAFRTDADQFLSLLEIVDQPGSQGR